MAIDLPGIRSSGGDPTDGSKWQLGAPVHELIEELGPERVTVVGQDVEAMIAYAHLGSSTTWRERFSWTSRSPG